MGRALDNQHASWAFTGSRTWRPRLTAAPRYLAAAERDGRLRVPEKRRGAGHSPVAMELERRTERPPAQALGHTPPPRTSKEMLVRGRKRVSPQSRKFFESSGFANGPRGSSRVAHTRTRGQPPPPTPSGQRFAFLLQGRPPHPRASMARPGPALHLPQPAAGKASARPLRRPPPGPQLTTAARPSPPGTCQGRGAGTGTWRRWPAFRAKEPFGRQELRLAPEYENAGAEGGTPGRSPARPTRTTRPAARPSGVTPRAATVRLRATSARVPPR